MIYIYVYIGIHYIYEYINIYRNILYIMKYYSAIKKKNDEIMLFAATWMDLIILREASQKEKDKYHMVSLTCGI